jgi:hypothetical protein
MAELNLEKVANNMGGLVKIQKEMLTILRASSTAMKAQSKAMETLGASAKETTKDVKEVETLLTRFIGSAEKGFLRRTSGPAGIFHKLMYGVPGYFIFKNRLDTLLSGIDTFVAKPLAGGNKEGFIASVFYGVGGSFRKSKDQLESIFKMKEAPTFAGLFEGLESGTLSSKVTSKESLMKRIKAPIKGGIEAIKNSSIVEFIKSERGRKKKMSRYRAWLSSKALSYHKRLDKVAKKAGMFFAVSLLVIGKALVIGLLVILGVYAAVKIAKRLGVTGEGLMKWASNILALTMVGISTIGRGLGTVLDGLTLMYEAIFKDGSFSDLLKGFATTLSGLLEVAVGIMIILLSPVLAGIATILGKEIDDVKRTFKNEINKIAITLMAIGALIALVPLIAFGIFSLPALLAGVIVAAIGAIILAINPFANGGVTKSGLSLVGERGPELVRLPKGSRVHSNQESRKMMSSGGNNITVNINGRVGSSDSELRIIAQKVGNMINKEINRTTSSRSLGA